MTAGSASFRVVSYNLRDFRDDLSAAVRVIRALSPDVLCLQEVPRHPLSGHRVADLANRTGLYWPGGHRGAGGTTLLTSLRVAVHTGRHSGLPVRLRDRQRGYAVSVLSLPCGPRFTAVSVHLSLSDAERERHTGMVLGTLPSDGPVVLGGDLNEQSDGRAWHAIGGRMKAVTPDEPTFPAKSPRRRLDAVFATSQFQVAEAGPPPALDRTDLVRATDHLPVWVDLVLTGAGA